MDALEEKYRIIFETTASATIIVEEDTTISLANTEFSRLCGYSKEELEGKRCWTEFIFKDDVEMMKGYHSRRRIDADLAPRNYATRLIARNGEVREVLATVAMIPGTQQSVASFMDMTDRKKAEEEVRSQQQQLIQADKLATLGILVSGIAHEINNPVNFIMLNAKIGQKVWNDITPILREYYNANGDFSVAGLPYSKAAEKIGQLLSGISEGAARIEKIITGLKNYARKDSGEVDPAIDVNAVMESAVVLVQDLIRKSTNHFAADYGKNLPPVRGNFQQLEQVIINLITNACQALPQKERGIALSSSYDPEADAVRITVSDEGEGIPPENMKHIMDPFFTTKRNSGGTGLGLSISYNIVKNHGGSLRLTSEPGKGTAAEMTLPAHHSPAAENGK